LLTYVLFRVTDKVEIYRVKTGSMEEIIHAGDYIMIYRKDDYNVGDIVTYTSNDGFITHRIIRKNGDKIVTKGDANNSEDNEIVASTIVGETILIGGILNVIINYKYIIVCILISLYLFSCYFDDEKMKKANDESENDEAQAKFETKECIKDDKIDEIKDTNAEELVKTKEETKDESLIKKDDMKN